MHITGWGSQTSGHGLLLTPFAPGTRPLLDAIRSLPGCTWSEVDTADPAQIPTPLTADLVVAAPIDADACRWVLTEFRANWQRALVPLVLVLPVDDPDLVREAYERGTDYVATPQESSDLLCARVRGLLHLRTTVKLLYESRNRAKDRLEQHERWARYLVHDLRGPLSSLTLGLTTLKTARGLGDEDREFVGQLREEIGRLSSLVGDLLDHERLQTGRLVPQRRSQDVSAIVQAVVQRSRLRGSARKVELRTVDGPQPAFATLDRALIDRVLENLLANAIAHSPPGQAVDVELTADDGLISMAVLNSGPPIPPELRETIFEPYVQVGPADRQPGGVGLGLAFCRGVVRAHGGSIQATERAGRTCFVVQIPR